MEAGTWKILIVDMNWSQGDAIQMIHRLDQPPAFGEFKKWHAFSNRSAGNAKEVFPISDGKPTVAFRNVGGDRKGSAVKLVDKEVKTARKCLRERADLVRKIHGFLENDQFFEAESQWRDRRSEE